MVLETETAWCQACYEHHQLARRYQGWPLALEYTGGYQFSYEGRKDDKVGDIELVLGEQAKRRAIDSLGSLLRREGHEKKERELIFDALAACNDCDCRSPKIKELVGLFDDPLLKLAKH